MTTAELLAHPRVQAALHRIEERHRTEAALRHYEGLLEAASKIGADPQPAYMSDASAAPYSRALPVDTDPSLGVSAPMTPRVAA